MATGTFDPKEVSVIVSGFSITGFADAGDAIVWGKPDDQVTLVDGADGDSIFVLTRKTKGTVTLKLLQSSASNDILSGIRNAAEIGVAVPFPIGVLDNNGTSKALAEKVMIQKAPDSAFGNDHNEREWILLCADLRIFTGGVS